MTTEPVSQMRKCEACGWEVDDEILGDSPDCPHGWITLEGMAPADIKAVFAADAEWAEAHGKPALDVDVTGLRDQK